MGGDGQGEKPLVRFDVEDGVGVITIDNPPVNALAPGVRDGIVEAVEQGEADPKVAGDGDDRGGAQLHRRRRHPRLRQAAHRPQAHHLRCPRRQQEAGGGRDPRLRARRRPGDCAGLPLPHRRADRQGRAARGADRHPAGRRGHAAPAAPDRSESGAGDDRLGTARAGRGGSQARRSRCHRPGQGPAQGSHRLRQAGGRQAPVAARARHDRQAGRGAARYVRRDAQVDRAQGAQPEGTLRLHRLCRGGHHHAVRRGHQVRACAVHRAGERRRGQGPALRLLRRARGRQDPRPAEGHWCCRRSRRSRWSEPAPWAAASP